MEVIAHLVYFHHLWYCIRSSWREAPEILGRIGVEAKKEFCVFIPSSTAYSPAEVIWCDCYCNRSSVKNNMHIRCTPLRWLKPEKGIIGGCGWPQQWSQKVVIGTLTVFMSYRLEAYLHGDGSFTLPYIATACALLRFQARGASVADGQKSEVLVATLHWHHQLQQLM